MFMWGIITPQSCTKLSKLGAIHIHVHSPQFNTSTFLPVGLSELGLLDANHGAGFGVFVLPCVFKWMMGIKILSSYIKPIPGPARKTDTPGKLQVLTTNKTTTMNIKMMNCAVNTWLPACERGRKS